MNVPLNTLIRERDKISKEMEPVVKSQRNLQQAVDFEKEQEHKAVISQVEKLLSTKIKATTATGRFVKTDMGMFPQMDIKDSLTLIKEQGQIVQSLNDLYFNGEIDLKSKQKMTIEVIKEYQKMINDAPRPSLDKTGADNQKENKPNVANSNGKEQQYRHKYGYDMMSEDEKEIFEERLRQQREKEKLEEERELNGYQFEEKTETDKGKMFDMDELFREEQMIEEINREQEEIHQNHRRHM